MIQSPETAAPMISMAQGAAWAGQEEAWLRRGQRPGFEAQQALSNTSQVLDAENLIPDDILQEKTPGVPRQPLRNGATKGSWPH